MTISRPRPLIGNKLFLNRVIPMNHLGKPTPSAPCTPCKKVAVPTQTLALGRTSVRPHPKVRHQNPPKHTHLPRPNSLRLKQLVGMHLKSWG